jgi:hypothetical protein
MLATAGHGIMRMTIMKKPTTIMLGLTTAVILSGAAMAASPVFSLKTLEKGAWTLRDKDHDMKTVGRICLGNAEALVHARHRGKSCDIRQLRADGRIASFRYSCNGVSGNTSIRRETDRLVQIRSQGLDHNEPFAFDYEARQTGPC